MVEIIISSVVVKSVPKSGVRKINANAKIPDGNEISINRMVCRSNTSFLRLTGVESMEESVQIDSNAIDRNQTPREISDFVIYLRTQRFSQGLMTWSVNS